MKVEGVEPDLFHIESDPDLFRVRDWAGIGIKTRVIQTVVGPYGALDQRSGTTYFDIGDFLIRDYGQIIVLSAAQGRKIVGE